MSAPQTVRRYDPHGHPVDFPAEHVHLVEALGWTEQRPERTEAAEHGTSTS